MADIVPVSGALDGPAERALALDAALEAWLFGLAPATARAYRADLAHLGAFLAQRGRGLAEATPADLVAWVDSGRARGRSPATLRRRLSAVAGCYRALVDAHVVASSPAEGLRRPKGAGAVRLGLERAELCALLDAARAEGHDAELLVSVLLFSGLRVAEACSLDHDDLFFFEGHLGATVRRKGGHLGHVALPGPLPGLVAAARARHGPGPLLLGRRGRRLRPEAAWRTLRRLGEQAGIARPVHPHLLRHSFATQALLASVPIETVAAGAGHRDLRSTLGYARALEALGGAAGEAVARRLGA